MMLEGQLYFFSGNAVAIVGHADLLNTTAQNLNEYLLGPGVYGVLQQPINHRCRPLYYFPGGYLGCQLGIKYPDDHGGRSLPATQPTAHCRHNI